MIHFLLGAKGLFSGEFFALSFREGRFHGVLVFFWSPKNPTVFVSVQQKGRKLSRGTAADRLGRCIFVAGQESFISLIYGTKVNLHLPK